MQTPYAPQVYVPGQEQQQKPYGRVYVPGKQQLQQHQYNQTPYGGHHQYSHQPQTVNAYQPSCVQPAREQQQQLPVVEAVAYNGQQTQGIQDGERGIVSTGFKMAAVAGAASVAYGMYNQYTQSHETGYPGQQQPPSAAHGQQPPSYGQTQQQYLPPSTTSGGHPPQQSGVLTIFLDRATNLANKDVFSKTDPYVRFEIEQDNWLRDYDHGHQISSKKQDDLNPVYGETFYFNLKTLKNMVLKIKIMDDDGFLSRDDRVASCKIKLNDLGLTQHPVDVEKVIDRNIFTKNGKIFLKLSYSGEP